MIKDLVSITIMNVKNKIKNLEKDMRPILNDLISEQILSINNYKLDGLMGVHYPDNDIRKHRKQLLDSGEFDDRIITVG